jgi:hypothetical protein
MILESYAYYIDGNLAACQVLGTNQVTSTNHSNIAAGMLKFRLQKFTHH